MSIINLFENFQNKLVDEASVKTLMESILNNYILIVNNEKYHFCEIELYYQAPKHKDCIVIKREKQAGDIFFHRYGIDVCFTSKSENEYGGVLIRSLKKEDKYILGPLSCSLTILNSHEPHISISIEQIEQKEQKIIKTMRIKSLCTKLDHGNYNGALYRYMTEDIINAIQDNKKYYNRIQKKLEK